MKKNNTISKMMIDISLITVSLILAYITLDLKNSNLSVPLSYSGDSLFIGYNVKTIQEFGWWFKNPKVGMPFGATVYDFPLYFDSLSFFIIKFLLIIFGNWGKAINVFYIIQFPMTALISKYVMREFKINNFIAFLGSVCYAFLPYRFLRSTNHLFLSAYYFIPIIILILYWIYSNGEMLKISRDRKNILIILVLIITPISGIYYAFFYGIFSIYDISF